MYRQNSLESRDINYIYEDSWVWVNLNSIKNKNVGLYREILEYYRNKRRIYFCFFKGRVNRFVSNREVEIFIYIDDNYETLKNNINYEIIENVKYLLPIDTNFGCKDNTELIYLNPPNVLENIYQRYNNAYMSEENRNCIYTYIGYILLSINPYTNFKIYDDNYMNKVRNENNLFSIPHPFSIANDAYNCLMKDQISQSIIISGESGSGKTESSKQVLKYLTYLSSCNKDVRKRIINKKQKKYYNKSEKTRYNNDDQMEEIYDNNFNEFKNEINQNSYVNKFDNISNNHMENQSQKKNNMGGKSYYTENSQYVSSYEEKIQNSNPLLESFGNAKTIKNDNSSRFGKLMKLNYDENGILCSASIETYLLAKSRVVNVPCGEGNYHIFYALCQNKSIAEKFNLLPWYKYNYLKDKNKLSDQDGNENDSKQNFEEEDGEETQDDSEQIKNMKNEKNKKTRNKRKKTEEMGKNKYEKNRINNLENINYDINEDYKKCPYDLDVIIKCFRTIGVMENEQNEIYKTLICILLLGNIDFIEDKNEEGEKPLKIKNMNLCEQLNKLLGIDQDISGNDTRKILEILTIKKVRETQKNYTYQQAIYNRDVISKALYQLLFEYVILRVNDSLNVKQNFEEWEDNQDEDQDLFIESQEEDENEGNFKKRKHQKMGLVKNKKNIIENENYNDDIEKNNNKYFIGILDIYGFENFSLEGINGFEQLCINYANEILHSFFLKQIIYNEHKIHYEENLSIGKVKYSDNSNVISLIGDNKNISIYTILEDLALLFTSNKSDEENNKNVFFEKLNKHVINSSKYKYTIKNYKDSKNSFIICHYAGNVLYDSNDFFNKNVDILTNDIEEFLSSCNSFISINLLKKKRYDQFDNSIWNNENNEESQINNIYDNKHEEKSKRRKLSVKEIICGHESEQRWNCGMHNEMNNLYKNKVKSIFSSFKKQLEVLTNKLELTCSKFIRCIKPNEEKAAKYFNKNLVLNQLVMSGMIDILNLMKKGYPCRVLYDDIWKTYNKILQDDMKTFLTPRMFCELVLKFLQINYNEYTFGKTKIFFRFGVLSLINEILLNKNEKKKKKFIECVYKFWLARRKRRLLNFVLFGCRFKILFKKQRWKMLMNNGLQMYNNYLFKEQKKNLKKILIYYFNVYKQRVYFLDLKKSTIIIQKNYRKYICRKKFMYIKRMVRFIEDYYIFRKYYQKRVNASNIIRKYWLTYITKSDYKYVINSVIRIQRAFKIYMKKKYIDYCLNGDQAKKEEQNIYFKKNNVPMRNKICDQADRIGSFIYIHPEKKRRHSFSVSLMRNSMASGVAIYQGVTMSNSSLFLACASIGENMRNSSKSQCTFKRTNTWSIGDNASKYGYNFPAKINSDPKRVSIENDFRTYDSIYNKNDIAKNQEKQINGRRSYSANIPFMKVGNIPNNKQSKTDEGKKNIFNKKKDSKVYGKNKYRFSNLATCSSIVDSNLKNATSKKSYQLKCASAGKLDMNIKSYNYNNTKSSFVSSYKGTGHNASSLLKNTIYDRYIEKYKQNHTNKQKETKKKSIYIKNNYSNISNIYSIRKPTKEENLKRQYNFDLTDALIIPEDFYVCESYIPTPNIMHENNENYLMFCQYLDRNVNSRIPVIHMNVFKCSEIEK
ncbi:myosin K, putative [Plasmodium chabaudi chabaudi]|uniref:Myosin K, putative n=1 Tax=Plasmodium chabaudi chabaudi TaxID=31271 RepID=A0A4V6M936_PLACU|nr:myosin K, putative [Plasmodium chabaudi chabaudi]VTZ67967.1 myosin K, putative [Plasmodium chabaudi chabaudi]|eukprot:XP_016653570.1 myosin heavy chain subunit, putative [Plasmodium chabaudi chabaudi]